MNLITVILAAELLAAGAAQAQDPQTLLQKYKCNICHANDETKTGPAFVDVASRYRGEAKAVSTLTAEIRDGAHGAGPWHMPPHPEVSKTDARKMARHILALRK